MRFGLALLAATMLAGPACAINIVHSGDNPFVNITTDNGRDLLYAEADYNFYVDGLNTVRLDVQGGTLKNSHVSMSWFGGIYVKTGSGVQLTGLSGADGCGFGGTCTGYPFGTPAFLNNPTFGDTFVEFTINAPKSYYDCGSVAVGVCGQRWDFQEIFNAEIVGSGPKSFTVTYSGDKEYIPPSVPEPASWAMMIAGFGLAGIALRRTSPKQLQRHGEG